MMMDLTAAILLALAVWVVDYKTSQAGIKEGAIPKETQKTGAGADASGSPSIAQQEDDVAAATKMQDWHCKFADKFSNVVIATEDSYTSPHLSIQLSYLQYDAGNPEDASLSGHNNKVSYALADIYVSDIACIQTAFAQDIYGNGYSERLTDMSAKMKSVLAVNGDSYNKNHRENNGTIIRNGVVYRESQSDTETCVLNWDGTMDIYAPGEADLQRMIANGAYQSWVFGPGLLDENGKAKSEFNIDGYIQDSHPRTAIGYYEPGHYCLLLVDGRQKDSRGMFLDEMAKTFENLGCKAAYNLDGGHSSLMVFQNQVASHPASAALETEGISDGIFITDGY